LEEEQHIVKIQMSARK